MLPHILATVLCLIIGGLGLAAATVFCVYSVYVASYSPFAETVVLQRKRFNPFILTLRSLKNAVLRYIDDWFTNRRCPPTDRCIFLGSLLLYGVMIAVGLTPLTGWRCPWLLLIIPALLPATMLLYSLAEAVHTMRLVHADRPTAMLRILERAYKSAYLDPRRCRAVIDVLRDSAVDFSSAHEPVLLRLAQSTERVPDSSLPALSEIAVELLHKLNPPAP